METITGKIKKIIFQSDNDYIVALFRVYSSGDSLKELINKTITITGTIINYNDDQLYDLEGTYTLNPKYGYQFSFVSYNNHMPTSKEALVEYLSSSIIKGCGKKTAVKIADYLGSNAIEIIKEDPSSLKQVSGLSEAKIEKIYNSIVANTNIDELLIKLKKLGFTINEATRIIKQYGSSTNEIVENEIYLLTDIVDFNKIDRIFCLHNDSNDLRRLKACILQSLSLLSINNGDTYSTYDEIEKALTSFGLTLNDDVLNSLISDKKIIHELDKYFLSSNYEMEIDIATRLKRISNRPVTKNLKLEQKIEEIEFETGIKYNHEQREAIINALNNRISIITGGPGTGKTTIINAIVRIFISINKLNPIDVYSNIALLAPTGRASKKISLATGYNASTIHRFLKWNKESDSFGINEYNPLPHRLIIVDEVSMIDSNLFMSLLKGLTSNITLVLVGDYYQLPSVGAGLVLHDLIESDLFSFNPLNQIFRQSKNSYIPYLAKEIKESKTTEDLFLRKDDYNFLSCRKEEIQGFISEICTISINKGLSDRDIQVLAPIYKGNNGLDNLNILLREIFNPYIDQREIKIGDVIYREKDKVIQLVNNPDLNVYNGDVGYILNINNDEIVIDFEGTRVNYNKKDMKDVMHAYAISIHKSQGSEFNHVIMPVESGYKKLLYNKLIYTGVSRAKKSLVIIGEKESLISAIKNNYATNRKTDLLNKLMHIFEK